jgi:hypothetical protein
MAQRKEEHRLRLAQLKEQALRDLDDARNDVEIVRSSLHAKSARIEELMNALLMVRNLLTGAPCHTTESRLAVEFIEALIHKETQQ